MLAYLSMVVVDVRGAMFGELAESKARTFSHEPKGIAQGSQQRPTKTINDI